MKNIFYAIAISAAALLAACSSGKEDTGGSDEYGDVRISVVASAQVGAATRATVDLPTASIPDADAFALRITGTYNDDMGYPQSYDQSWATLGAYDAPKLRRGDYAAEITYGDPEAEGPAAACFSGSQSFAILARKTVTATVTASLRNAAFRVSVGEWFNKYYTNAQITIRTESGNSFAFTPTNNSIVFVKTGTKLFMKGTAIKSQTGTAVEFPETEIGTTAARTLHTIAVEASEAGGGQLLIDLDDTFTEIGEQVIELNPEA